MKKLLAEWATVPRIVMILITIALLSVVLPARASAQVQCRSTNSVATAGWYIDADPAVADLLWQIDEGRKKGECVLLSGALRDPPPKPRMNPARVPKPRPRPDYPAVEPAGDKLKSPASVERRCDTARMETSGPPVLLHF